MMRLVHDDFDLANRPIPFPGRDADRSSVGAPSDSIRMVEDALNRVQSGLDEMSDLLRPIPFEAVDDDGPRAA